MKQPLLFCLSASLLLVGCGKSSDTPAQSTNATGNGSSPLSAPADYLGALDKGKKSAVATVDTASVNQAIQQFNIGEGRNPKDLNELVEKQYLPRIPAAPYGMTLQYDATSGKVKVVKQ